MRSGVAVADDTPCRPLWNSGNKRKSGNGHRKTDDMLVFFVFVKFLVAGLLSKVVPPVAVAGAVFFLLVLIGFREGVFTNDVFHCWSWNPAWWAVANGWHGGGAAWRIVFEFLVAKQSYNSTTKPWETTTWYPDSTYYGTKKTAKFNGEYQKSCTSSATQLKGNV